MSRRWLIWPPPPGCLLPEGRLRGLVPGSAGLVPGSGAFLAMLALAHASGSGSVMRAWRQVGLTRRRSSSPFPPLPAAASHFGDSAAKTRGFGALCLRCSNRASEQGARRPQALSFRQLYRRNERGARPQSAAKAITSARGGEAVLASTPDWAWRRVGLTRRRSSSPFPPLPAAASHFGDSAAKTRGFGALCLQIKDPDVRLAMTSARR